MTRVGYLVDHQRSLSPEEKAAWHFLRSCPNCHPSRISLASIARHSSILRQIDVLWWHYDSSPDLPVQALDPAVRFALRGHVERGRGLLLSLLASSYVVDLGFETVHPNVRIKGTWKEKSWAEEYPDIRGFGAFRGHPIFEGFAGGLFTWSPRIGEPRASAYYDGTSPSIGKALAVEKLYIGLNEKRCVVTEYAGGAVLAIGDHLYFREKNQRFRKHLEAFTAGCLYHLGVARESDENRHQFKSRKYWTYEPREVRQFQHSSPTVRKSSSRLIQNGDSVAIHRDLSSPGGNEQFYDLGGLRMLMMGYERGGVEEVWVHPLRVFRQLRIGFIIGSQPVRWSNELNPVVTIRPESLTRQYELEGARITEVIFADRSRPGGVLNFAVRSPFSVRIVLTGVSDLRLMWPLSENVTGSLEYAWDEGLNAVIIRDDSGSLHSIVGSTIRSSATLVGHYGAVEIEDDVLVGRHAENPQVAFGIEISLHPGQTRCSFVFAGSSQGYSGAVATYRSLARHQDRSLRQQARYFSHLLKRSVQVNSPDEQFNRAYRWALISTDRFFTDTPETGRSFMAGFGLSTAGWNGTHAISGRPGYAWYFGRDSVWTSLAALAYGDMDKVREVLEFLGRYQDVDGKILHEMTSSGFAHYDAADATPLYLILMGRYLRASGDETFVRRQFPGLLKAISYCLSTDTDGDHLIENTNSGHGWVEGGALFPVHTEHYLAACWGEALKECGFIARTLGRRALAKNWISESARVKGIVKRDFWNPKTGFYNFGKRKDGTFNEEKTILPVVGMYFDPNGQEKAQAGMAELAGETFSTDWGVRIVGSDNKLFKPTGYHYGSVWPLFTGWAALAEFRLGRPLQGYNHLLSNMALTDQFSACTLEEVLHGEVFKPGGVCPHQAWSESMILQPLLEGMLGLTIDATTRSICLAPYLPPQWKSFRIDNLRVGGFRLNVKISRTAQRTTFRIRPVRLRSQHSPPPSRVLLHLRAILPLGSLIHEIVSDGKVQKISREIVDFTDSPLTSVSIGKPVDVVIQHTLGVAAVPRLPHLQHGSPSKGLRIMDESWKNGVYQLSVAGRKGMEYLLDVADPEGRIQSVEGATILARDKEHAIVLIRFPAGEDSAGYERRLIRLGIRSVSRHISR